MEIIRVKRKFFESEEDEGEVWVVVVVDKPFESALVTVLQELQQWLPGGFVTVVVLPHDEDFDVTIVVRRPHRPRTAACHAAWRPRPPRRG